MRGHNFSRSEHDDLEPAMELIRAPSSWRDDWHRVADLGRWLENRCHFRTVEERWTFIDKLAREGNDELYREMEAEERDEEQRRMYEDEAFAELERRRGPA